MTVNCIGRCCTGGRSWECRCSKIHVHVLGALTCEAGKGLEPPRASDHVQSAHLDDAQEAFVRLGNQLSLLQLQTATSELQCLSHACQAYPMRQLPPVSIHKRFLGVLRACWRENHEHCLSARAMASRCFAAEKSKRKLKRLCSSADREGEQKSKQKLWAS